MITFEKDGNVGLITINRPDARNAVNAAVAEGIEEGIDRLEADDEIWVGILTGAGPVFCAGADLKEIAAGNGASLSTERGGFAGIVRRLRTKPVIAAVNGPALAGGTEIVLSCDMVVASDMATFGVPEVKRSLVAAAGGVFRLPMIVGRMVANEMISTGDPISAERAHSLGMVNHVVPGHEVMIHARQLAGRICEAAPLAVRESLAIAAKAGTHSEEELFSESLYAFARLAQTEDFQEGPRAFIEKRSPEWKGR